ncbi:MAG: hypothetical protein AAF098_18100 [Pseudomonadota bacterium]
MNIRIHTYRYRSFRWSQIVSRGLSAAGVLIIGIALVNGSDTETPFKKPIRALVEHSTQIESR